jgi:acetolactate synthase-1/2/3 large subunit
MGFAVGAVVGAKVGCPTDTCIGFTGDGAFMMQGSEISTARQNKIGAIWIVLSDNNLSMVSQGMNHFVPDEKQPKIWDELYELGNPDLVKYSEGLGADAYEVNSPKDFHKIMPTVLKRANKDGIPQVIIANINTKAIPPYYNEKYSAKNK